MTKSYELCLHFKVIYKHKSFIFSLFLILYFVILLQPIFSVARLVQNTINGFFFSLSLSPRILSNLISISLTLHSIQIYPYI
jgi:hypothetical protein